MRSISFVVVYILQLFIVKNSHASTSANSNAHSPSSSVKLHISKTEEVKNDLKKKVLVLDVDNTFYSEAALRKLGEQFGDHGVEEQIVQKTHTFCQEHLNMTTKECDNLYQLYGSTPEGLRVKITDQKELHHLFKIFYDLVYNDIDLNSLVKYSHHNPQTIAAIIAKDESNISTTGYTHESSSISKNLITKSLQISNLLEEIKMKDKDTLIYLASNSPYIHIIRILKHMGLYAFPFDGIITPDFYYHHKSKHFDEIQSGEKTDMRMYPTKASPIDFFQPMTQKHSRKEFSYAFVDDSKFNLQKAQEANIGFDTIYHINEDYDLCSALKDYLYEIENKKETKSINGDVSPYTKKTSSLYEFSEEKYLLSKNIVDANSINLDIWEYVVAELTKRSKEKSSPISIVDLGAGLLSILDFLINGLPGKDGKEIDSKTSLFAEDEHYDHNLVYYAFEPNQNLKEGCLNKMMAMGFQEIESIGEVQTYKHSAKHITVHLIMNDFRNNIHKASNLIKVHGTQPDLIVGCCFADLFPSPRELIASILEISNPAMDNTKSPSTLLYFPITFGGTTLFNPPQPFGIPIDKTAHSKMIPSDTLALRIYAQILKDTHDHNLDPKSIIKAAELFGLKLISSGASDWNIDPNKHLYLWDTMKFFFKTVIANDHEWDMKAWFDRMHNSRPSIIAKNVDLLFQFDSDGHQMSNKSNKSLDNDDDRSSNQVEQIEFVAPYKVRSVKKKIVKSLGPNEIEIQSICSLISSGTELKIFRGTFDNTEPLDVNIKGMSDTAMAYPLTYGYSLVGKVIRCGSAGNKHLMGKHVFTFSPHSSRVIANIDSVHVVPDGIQPEDAIFLPSVETALSIIHDAHIRMGERVAIFGQGLIGLLVTSILSMNKEEMKADSQGLLFDTVTVFDTILDRLAIASKVGASEALLPSSAMSAGPFDATIEVSGNGRALQSAIDCTRDHGRIIIGSWYGNTDVPLSLGMDFHRSHKTLLATQVSEIPPALRGIWSKERRFNLSWELVRRLKPSLVLVTRWEALKNAQKAYDTLASGKEISVAFSYD